MTAEKPRKRRLHTLVGGSGVNVRVKTFTISSLLPSSLKIMSYFGVTRVMPSTVKELIVQLELW